MTTKVEEALVAVDDALLRALAADPPDVELLRQAEFAVATLSRRVADLRWAVIGQIVKRKREEE